MREGYRKNIGVHASKELYDIRVLQTSVNVYFAFEFEGERVTESGQLIFLNDFQCDEVLSASRTVVSPRRRLQISRQLHLATGPFTCAGISFGWGGGGGAKRARGGWKGCFVEGLLCRWKGKGIDTTARDNIKADPIFESVHRT